MEVGTAMKRERPSIAQGILEYLLENPNAEDTLEGVVQWWLLDRTIKQQTLAVKKALASLVEDGLVVAVTGRDERIHYRINKRRRQQVASLLRK